jgi:phasin family protein
MQSGPGEYGEGGNFIELKEIPMNSPPQAEFLDLYRTGLKSAVDLMKTSLENAERLQSQQLSAIRDALQQHAKSVNALSEAKSLDQLMALQQQMAGAQFERLINLWGNFYQAAGQSQVVAISQAQAQMAQARDWFNETCALTARATDEAAQLAAAQAAVQAGVRKEAEAVRQGRKSA